MMLPRGHAEPRELVAYHAGQMADEDAERLRDHLALCSECSDLLLDLIHFDDLELPEGVAGPSEAEVELALESLKGRLREGEEGRRLPDDPPVPLPFPVRPGDADSAYYRPTWQGRLPWAVATGFALLSLALGAQLVMRQGLKQPAMVLSQLIDGRSDVRSSPSGGLPATSTVVQFELDRLAPDGPFAYRVLLRHAGGEVVGKVEIPSSFEEDIITLILSHRELDPGRYEVELLRIAGRMEKSLKTIEVEIPSS